MKKIIYVVILAVGSMVLNSCFAGFVATEPSYVEYSRPERPSTQYIWIDGDWGWNYQTHVYVQKAGYWDRPRQGQSYQPGHWQSNAKGKSWSNGRWQKQGKR
jgi:hypothetical protein